MDGEDAPDIAAENAGEEIALFNGKDFTGWTYFSEDSETPMEEVWSVKDGVIHTKGEPRGYMRTKEKYTNFILKVQWRFPEGKGNSGVLLRVQEPDRQWPKSVEAQLMSGKAGVIYQIGGFPLELEEGRERKGLWIYNWEESSEKPLGEWNDYEIIMDGGDLTLIVNGVLQNRVHEVEEIPGYILLQAEGVPVEFRNIRLTPLNDQ